MNSEYLRIIIKMAFLLDNSTDMDQTEVNTLQENMNISAVELGFIDYIDALHKLK